MAARLILNADDFGLTLGVNRAIRELHQGGVLTSATLMATGRAFEDAVTIARANPTLGVGCHIVLSDGMPVSPPGSIPSLIGGDGKHFRASLSDFGQALLRGKIRETDIEHEAHAQVEKLQRAGIKVTHLDTHKHTHMFPLVARPLLRLAENSSIAAIRNPFEPNWCRSLGRGPLLRRLQLAMLQSLQSKFNAHRQIRNACVLTSQGSLGVSATGQLNSESLKQILISAPDGIWEVVLHPGYNDSELDTVSTRLRVHRDIERKALLEVIPQILAQPNPPDLIHYGELGSFGVQRETAVHIPSTDFNLT